MRSQSQHLLFPFHYTRAIATVLHEIRGDVEGKIGRQLSVTTDVAIRLVRRVKAGEAFDLLVAAPGQLDELIAAGLIVRETRTDIAHSGIGVAVRRGATKPDVGSMEAFARALLDARSIAYLREGQSGIYIDGVLRRPSSGSCQGTPADVTSPGSDQRHEITGHGTRHASSLKS